MNAAAITTDHAPDPPTRRLYRRALSLCGLTLYSVTHHVTATAGRLTSRIAGRLLGFISWVRRETTEGARLVVRVGGVVVWVAFEVARVVPVVVKVVPRVGRMGGMT